MAHWYYKGTTTTPIAHPERGPIVLSPKRKIFEAPASAVAHLISVGLVVPAKAPKTPAAQAAGEVASTRSLQEEPESGSSADGSPDVVESASKQQPLEEAVVAESQRGPEQPKKKQTKRKTESSEDR